MGGAAYSPALRTAGCNQNESLTASRKSVKNGRWLVGRWDGSGSEPNHLCEQKKTHHSFRKAGKRTFDQFEKWLRDNLWIGAVYPASGFHCPGLFVPNRWHGAGR